MLRYTGFEVRRLNGDARWLRLASRRAGVIEDPATTCQAGGVGSTSCSLTGCVTSYGSSAGCSTSCSAGYYSCCYCSDSGAHCGCYKQ